MRLLIASDLHGSLSSLRFLVEKAHEITPDRIVLLGDLVYHGPRNPLPEGYNTQNVIQEIMDLVNLPCSLTAVRGNCDAEVDLAQLPFPVAENAWVDVDNLHIFASHGHRLPERPPVPNMPLGSVILRGHTHIPRGETLDGLHFWNPGSLSLPKHGWPGTYGIYDNGTFTVYDVLGNTVLRHTPEA